MRPLLVLSLAAGLSLAATAAFANPGDPAAGEDVFKKCHACHDVGPGAKNKVGPQLNGIVGRKVGSVADYAYTDANKEFAAKVPVWTEAELLKYLESPMTVVPKTKMAFAGLPDEQDRLDVIAYLKTQTAQ